LEVVETAGDRSAGCRAARFLEPERPAPGPRSGRCPGGRLSRLCGLGPSAPGVEPSVVRRPASSVVGHATAAEELVASTPGKRVIDVLRESSLLSTRKNM